MPDGRAVRMSFRRDTGTPGPICSKGRLSSRSGELRRVRGNDQAQRLRFHGRIQFCGHRRCEPVVSLPHTQRAATAVGSFVNVAAFFPQADFSRICLKLASGSLQLRERGDCSWRRWRNGAGCTESGTRAISGIGFVSRNDVVRLPTEAVALYSTFRCMIGWHPGCCSELGSSVQTAVMCDRNLRRDFVRI